MLGRGGELHDISYHDISYRDISYILHKDLQLYFPKRKQEMHKSQLYMTAGAQILNTMGKKGLRHKM